MKFITFMLSMVITPSVAFSEIQLRECNLSQRCILGETCNEIDEPFSWIEIDGTRIEIKYGNDFLPTKVNLQTNSVWWERDHVSYSMQFIDFFQFLITTYSTVKKSGAAPLTEEQKIQKLEEHFEELLNPKMKEISSISISYGRCE